jgi:hypothetical protein
MKHIQEPNGSEKSVAECVSLRFRGFIVGEKI